jgi:hypothetical protein
MRDCITGSADEGARYLTTKLLAEDPFFFARVGDGAIECLDKLSFGVHTCDGERYTESLRHVLWFAIRGLRYRAVDVVWGDWATAVAGSQPRYVSRWEAICLDPFYRDELVNYESLLLMRESASLVEFYRAVKFDARRKVLVGSPWVAPAAAKMLRAVPIIVPGRPEDLSGSYAEILNTLVEQDPEVVLFGAGMEGFAAVATYWVQRKGDTVGIHLGSALDPLFKGKTRNNQLSTPWAKKLFRDLLEAN